MVGRQPAVRVLGPDGRVIGRTAVVGLVAALALTGCTTPEKPAAVPSETPSSNSPTTRPEAATVPERPRERACYRLSYDEALAPASDRDPGACAGDHTAMTYLVGDLDTLVDGHLLAVDSDRVQRQVATTCPARFGAFVGGTLEARRLSMLRPVWFTPTVEDSDTGESWFRCDVIALAGDERLARLSGRMAGVLGTEAGRDRYGICGTADPGSDNFERVICSGPHSWRALRTVAFSAKRYPGESRVRSAGEGPCEAAGRAAADDALSFRWGYQWPTREQWVGGQHYGLCWAPD